MPPVLVGHNLYKEYKFINHKAVIEKLPILQNISLELNKGEAISIVGSSGSGKTSLLQIMAGLDTADSGYITFEQKKINTMSEQEKNCLRNRCFGFIYQFHHLLAEFTVLENIMMPIIISNQTQPLYQEKADYLMNKLMLYKKANYLPNQLSGGERQRVAIMRALINSPSVVFADEPTGNLDNYTANKVMELFFNLQQEFNLAAILVTHDLKIAQNTSKTFVLQSGQLQQYRDHYY